ncbi:rhizoferrin biosystnesis N-citrylornithine decarboxylase FslC [Francisella tularensis]|uniref:rhizoferrin biosystnesis N-citrylornithine decarboxylase FslC n=1 Tax=Francisella tularensis TaxID=263 RepID=UPI000173E473|nr:rhizoferrin biosystnesis N-citrylornithine decarboxylase FslC [Francisella tularensis]ACD30190.1 diaminopimelate decarboxylase [Francisella tularensis subsp. mediasiatica FSC147]MBK2078254.1 diaminopimelate decarboxylase [Francisella tularensis subsp. mediasiatica]MBK2101322.1 diaminopimelate decarboxylase [Francisella tularensis subsp. mediasiatica]MBK2104283.1 diaminopimelate decarboxylase [Francisella tularensis subsp. mediasiatica]MDN9002491.1 rhizoferrin biosystnesis N-citrylornithine 
MSKLSNSKSVFSKLSNKQIETIIQRYASPCFIIDENALLERARLFQQAILNQYQNSIAAYSVKTQSLNTIIQKFYEVGFIPEVVSSDEFEQIQKLQLCDKSIIFNGPYKNDASLIKALQLNAMINCDHFDEILRIAKIAKKLNITAKIGLRVADNKTPQNWSRFGFALTDQQSNSDIFTTIDKIQQIANIQLAGLHCHIGTNIRDISRFTAMAKNIAELAETILTKYKLTLEWIDLGGGLAGISPTLSDKRLQPYNPFDLELYAATIIAPLKEYLNKTNDKTKLIFELGRSLVDYSVALLTTIVGTREQNEDFQSLITDAGIHTIPTISTYRHPIYHLKTDSYHKKTLLLGPSCMQHDFLHDDIFLPKLEYGDKLLIDGVGAYNISRNNEFIHLKPSVILIDKNHQYQVLRVRQTHQ